MFRPFNSKSFLLFLISISTYVVPLQAEESTIRPLNLHEATQRALQHNIDMLIKASETGSSSQDVNKAKSAIFPQAAARAQYEQIDSESVALSGGLMPERESTAGVLISQVLFDDEVFNQLRVARKNLESLQEEQNVLAVDITALVGKQYLACLSADAQHQIEVDNYKFTKKNLETAELRYKVGSAGPEDVYRWEAQLARQQSTVNNADTERHRATTTLNQSMGAAQSSRWKFENIQDNSDYFSTLDQCLERHIKSTTSFDRLMTFCVSEAITNSPSISAIDKAISAQKLSLGQLRRKGFLPRVTANFGYDYILDSETAEQENTAFSSEQPDDEWLFTVSASLPLFEGGGRVADVIKAKITTDRLEQTRERAIQLTELQVRQALFALMSSKKNIELSETAADRARKNLKIVQDKYDQGTLTILNVIDAQTQAFSEEQRAIVATYQYLQDLLEWQRAMSWYEFNQSDDGKKDWLARLRSFTEE